MRGRIKNNVIILGISILVGFLLLFLVHLLPTDKMQENVYWSKDTILAEFDDQLMIDGYEPTMSGSFTDCLMLEHAIYKSEGHSALEQAMRMYRGESCPEEAGEDAWWPGHSLMDYLDNVEQPREVEYPRYWHGYLVFLKPLLMLTSLNGIRMLNGIAMMLLLGLVLMICGNQKKLGLGVALLVSMPFLFFTTTFSSLSLSICYYIAMLSVLAVLVMKKRVEHALELFLMIGIVTAYFDFLTYPLVTLCFPLCTYLYLLDADTKQNIKSIALCSLEWGLGYGVMWASKWILSDVLTGSRVILDAWQTIFTRAGSASGRGRFGGFVQVLQANLGPFMNWSFGVLVLVILLYLGYRAGKIGWKQLGVRLRNVIAYPVVAFLPFLWWFVMQNHSEEHWAYTCRIFAIVVLSLVTGFTKLLEREAT